MTADCAFCGQPAAGSADCVLRPYVSRFGGLVVTIRSLNVQCPCCAPCRTRGLAAERLFLMTTIPLISLGAITILIPLVGVAGVVNAPLRMDGWLVVSVGVALALLIWKALNGAASRAMKQFMTPRLDELFKAALRVHQWKWHTRVAFLAKAARGQVLPLDALAGAATTAARMGGPLHG